MPTAGVPVVESSDSNVREAYVGNYRITYRVCENEVRILTVFHGARLLSQDRLKEEEH
jgi:plasmid stabilization system protein ParE